MTATETTPVGKASDLREGDELWTEGRLVYVVQSVTPNPAVRLVSALVRYEVDGGSDIRTWNEEDDVPHVRPIHKPTDG